MGCATSTAGRELDDARADAAGPEVGRTPGANADSSGADTADAGSSSADVGCAVVAGSSSGDPGGVSDDTWAALEAVPADARHSAPRGPFPAVFLRAYDGDTLTAAVAYRGGTHVVAVRLAGVNAPELKPPRAAPGRDATVAAARAARDALAAWGAGARRLTLEARGYEKYGRWLAVARPAAGGASLNRRLLDAGHAVPYLAEISD